MAQKRVIWLALKRHFCTIPSLVSMLQSADEKLVCQIGSKINPSQSLRRKSHLVRLYGQKPQLDFAKINPSQSLRRETLVRVCEEKPLLDFAKKNPSQTFQRKTLVRLCEEKPQLDFAKRNPSQTLQRKTLVRLWVNFINELGCVHMESLVEFLLHILIFFLSHNTLRNFP